MQTEENIIPSDPNYEYYAVKADIYYIFQGLRSEILEQAAKGEQVNPELVIKFMQMLRHVRSEEKIQEYHLMKKFVEQVYEFFKVDSSYMFQAGTYIQDDNEPVTILTSMNGFTDMISAIIPPVADLIKNGDVKSGAKCDENLILCLRRWLQSFGKINQFSKGQIITLASYISKNYFGFFKDRKISAKDKFSPYFQIGSKHLKDSAAFNKDFWQSFTIAGRKDRIKN